MDTSQVVSSAVIGAATVLAATIAAVASIKAARTAGHVNRKVDTNHGGTIGTHMEDLIDFADDTTAFLKLHQDSDNEVRQALGLDPVVLPLRRRRRTTQGHNDGVDYPA